MAQREEDPKGTESEYKVTDRRLFSADGTLRPGVAEADEEEEPQRNDRREPETDQPGFEHRPVDGPPGVDFTMLINAMAEPALLFLGEIAHPATGRPTVDLERARLQIDMLDLLRVKCRGNLTPDEESLLDRILYQVRMLYVSRANRPD
jgi:hypothetical protein